MKMCRNCRWGWNFQILEGFEGFFILKKNNTYEVCLLFVPLDYLPQKTVAIPANGNSTNLWDVDYVVMTDFISIGFSHLQLSKRGRNPTCGFVVQFKILYQHHMYEIILSK